MSYILCDTACQGNQAFEIAYSPDFERSMIITMKKCRKIFQEKIILSFVMCILLGVALFSATTAWYASNNTAVAHGMELAADGIGGLKVAIEPGGPDIMMLPEANGEGIPVIPIKLTDLNNVKEQMIAPGSYGPMTFYITSLGETVTGYSIKVKLSYREEDAAGDRLSPEEKARIKELMEKHISVYANMETVSSESGQGRWGRFSDPLVYYTDSEAADGTAATGELVFNTEIKAEIYWVWNYEYTDIPGNDNLPEDMEREKIREYDEEDTLLGNYVDNIWFDVYITGQTAEMDN